MKITTIESMKDFEAVIKEIGKRQEALAGFKMEEIIEKFKATPETAGYVFEALDKPKLSKVFGKNQKLREEIEKYGMGFTNPELNKIKVERKED